MLKPNPPGFHTTLTQQKIDDIIAAVPEVIIQNQVAHRAKVTPKQLDVWLDEGERDANLGKNDSIFAQLFHKYHYARTEVVKKNLDTLQCCPRNYQALTWTLEKCFRGDFGKDSDQIQKLLELVGIVIAEKGLQNGKAKEMDSESDQSEPR